MTDHLSFFTTATLVKDKIADKLREGAILLINPIRGLAPIMVYIDDALGSQSLVKGDA